MSKERLEEIKKKFDLDRINRFVDSKLISPSDLTYLIQQAEEKIQLEERFETLSDIHDRTLEENKRYKQALEFYANEINYQNFVELGKSNIEHDGGEKARQALEGGNADD